MNYAQQIKHPMWQKKRLEVLEANNFECEDCGAKEEELHVHHPFYRRGAMIWQYEASELQCLCHKCHKDAHALDERLKKAMAVANSALKWRALGALEAYELWSGRHDCMDEDKRIIYVENNEHGEGICDVFSITPPALFQNLSPTDDISLALLLDLRRFWRIRHNMNVYPPATEDEKLSARG